MNDCESTYNFNTHKKVIKVLGKNSKKKNCLIFLKLFTIEYIIYLSTLQ